MKQDYLCVLCFYWRDILKALWTNVAEVYMLYALFQDIVYQLHF